MQLKTEHQNMQEKKLIKLQGEVEKFTVVVKDFNAPLTEMS